MRNAVIILSSVVIVLASVAGFAFYRQHVDKEKALRASEEKVTELKEEVSSLNQAHEELLKRVKKSEPQIPVLEEKLKKAQKALEEAEHKFAEIESADKRRLADLESARKMKERKYADAEAKILDLQGNHQDLIAQLNQCESRALSFENKLKKNEEALETLRQKLSRLDQRKALTEDKLNELKLTYNVLILELENHIENQEVMIRDLEGKLSVTFVDRILFNSGEASITPEGKEILEKLGKILKYQSGRIRVVGHTDNVPIHEKLRSKFPTNWELSSARSAAVVRFLEDSGLDPEKMEAVGCSYHQPVAGNETPEGRARNRRVEIIITPSIESETHTTAFNSSVVQP